MRCFTVVGIFISGCHQDCWEHWEKIVPCVVLQDQSSSSFSFGHDLIRHNLVVFRGGEGALQVLPPLVDVIPEARLNLVIYYLKQVRFLWLVCGNCIEFFHIILKFVFSKEIFRAPYSVTHRHINLDSRICIYSVRNNI